MRQFLYAFCVAIAILSASTPAFATNDSRAFPPDNCTTGSPFMGFTGVSGSNTFCNSGQDILNNAIPTCGDGMQVAHEGGKFICKAQTNVPTCQPGTFLSFDGTNYTCNGTGVATCGANQVLTFNGTSYYCVNKDATIPVCTANQFLTYNGSYQCASVNTPSIPTCAAGQVLTGVNGQLTCVDGNNSGTAHCEIDQANPVLITNDLYLLFHRNADGTLAEGNKVFQDVTNNFGKYGVTLTYEKMMEPTGYQDQPAAGVNQCVGSASGLCYICVNGNWEQSYYNIPAPTPTPGYFGYN
jgi:hypothetical protein